MTLMRLVIAHRCDRPGCSWRVADAPGSSFSKLGQSWNVLAHGISAAGAYAAVRARGVQRLALLAAAMLYAAGVSGRAGRWLTSGLPCAECDAWQAGARGRRGARCAANVSADAAARRWTQLPGAARRGSAAGKPLTEAATGAVTAACSAICSNIAPQLNDSIDDPQIAGRFVALYSLMQGKELVGQERALGAIGLHPRRVLMTISLRQQTGGSH